MCMTFCVDPKSYFDHEVKHTCNCYRNSSVKVFLGERKRSKLIPLKMIQGYYLNKQREKKVN